jgi:hypothetical protein
MKWRAPPRAGPELLGVLAAAFLSAPAEGRPPEIVAEDLAVAEVVSEFPVGFSLLTGGDLQYVAFYDPERWMTVGMRRREGGPWRFQRLPSRIGWDSHNDVTLALDAAGHLHVAGNMHGVPLVYFRTETPGDLASLRPATMTGERESRVTYPKFLTDARGRLLFIHRDGGSGNGDILYSVYDVPSRTWTRLHDGPLFDGEGQRNAYPQGPVRDAQGWFHLVWVWRDTPDCATNHHLSHARSRDLVRWESASGQPVALPLRLAEDRLWVDPVPSGGGLLNGGERLCFARDGQPVVVYHKRDEAGHMQVYAARPEQGIWRRRALTAWTAPLPFAGRGTMGFIGIRLGTPQPAEGGAIVLSYRHRDVGSGLLAFDDHTLAPPERVPPLPPAYPPALSARQGTFPGLEIRRAGDLGDAGDPRVRYLLQWETLGPNQDRPREPPLPPPSRLRLIRLETAP